MEPSSEAVDAADGMTAQWHRVKSGNGTAKSSAAGISPIPKFEYNLSRPRQSHYGCIYAGDEVFCRIDDINGFFATLGYREEIRKTGMMLDEFLWERYRRDGAAKSAQCLQVQIAVYLHRHSAKFMAEFGRAFEEMLGKCIAECIDNDDAHCLDCPKHPVFAY